MYRLDLDSKHVRCEVFRPEAGLVQYWIQQGLMIIHAVIPQELQLIMSQAGHSADQHHFIFNQT